ncbi:hypothetical protein [Actinopolymorpha alba]|uniref:hypothetical protein n=1 Tax=Actinopolymorpha alba TaxID=533267 RepID=UPI00036A3FB2|nr:hypothetical protein [Actinopolymorpha alba]
MTTTHPTCESQFLGAECRLPAGHEGLHRGTCPCGCADVAAEWNTPRLALADPTHPTAGPEHHGNAAELACPMPNPNNEPKVETS